MMFQSTASPSYSFSNVPDAPPNPMFIPIPHPLLAFLMILTSLGSFFAAKIAQAVPVLDKPDILGSSFLSLMCLSGACAGAVVYVLTFARKDTRPDIISKAIVSTLVGFVLTPFLIRWWNWSEVPSVVLASSATISLLSWSGVQKAYPWLQDKVSAIFNKSESNKP